ncbi:SH3 domain-containing protein [Streptomyces sp. NPDC050161]|uniref:SH3 domain-containing protein n=1 Tax=Streptomyces sp. NPDC050161 TaxID=3365604 RepID=UPI0037897D94
MSSTQDQLNRAAEPADGEATVGTLAAERATYPLAPGYRVNIREGAGTNTPVVGHLPDGAHVRILCQRYGQWVVGPYGTSNIWDNIGPGQYISDSYVRTGSDGFVAQRCMA